MANRTIKCKALKLTGEECGLPMHLVKDQFTNRRQKVYVFRCYGCGAARAVTDKGK